MARKWLRWLPAVAVPAVIAAGALAGSLPASARDPLPAKTPEQVLALIAQHREHALTGTVEQSSEMGLPELPQAGPGAGSPDSAWLELLTGPHTARVYLDGTDKRVQVMDRFAERNAIRHGNELWFYNSRDNTAAHVQLPAGAADRHASADGTPPTPDELAGKLLAKLDASTEMSVGADTEVAGRAAYRLLLTPQSTATLLASIAVDVDGQSGLPLGVELKSRGQSDPAFRIAFTDVSLQAPDASVFAFTPPPGATVKEIPVPAHKAEGATPRSGQETKGAHRPTVTGSGWESVVELPAGTGESMSGVAPLLQQATVPVPGGRFLSTALVNALILDDGRVFAGSVPLERLRAAAAHR